MTIKILIVDTFEMQYFSILVLVLITKDSKKKQHGTSIKNIYKEYIYVKREFRLLEQQEYSIVKALLNFSH